MSKQPSREEEKKALTPREQRLRALQQQLQKNRETPPDLVPRPEGFPLSHDSERGMVPVQQRDVLQQRISGSAPPQAGEPGTRQQSLYQVIEVKIEDILESRYQTREAVHPEKYQRLIQSMREEKPRDFKDAIPVRPHPTQPGKWQVVRGGHTRLAAAREIGLSVYPVIIVQSNNKQSALGTARENLARDDLTPVEEGRLYLLLREEFGYSQESLSAELGISRDRMKECEAAAKSAPDILDMFQRLKTLGSDSSRGLRAAKYLRRLDALEKGEEGLAVRLRAPLIDAFLSELVTTDGLDIATKRLLDAEDPESVLAALIKDFNRKEAEPEQMEAAHTEVQKGKKKEAVVPEIQRSEKLNLVTRRFRQFALLMGNSVPSTEERQVLMSLHEEIEALLRR